jgi:hypothetical protein
MMGKCGANFNGWEKEYMSSIPKPGNIATGPLRLLDSGHGIVQSGGENATYYTHSVN